MHRAKYTPCEDEVIRQMRAAGSTFDEIGVALHRTSEGISARSHKLGLGCGHGRESSRWWTAEQDDLLRRQHGRRSAAWLAARLKRSMSAVENRISRLGLRGGRKGPFWTQAEDEVLREGVFEGQTASMVAAQLGRSRSSVISRSHAIGCRFRGKRSKGAHHGGRHDHTDARTAGARTRLRGAAS